VRIQHPSSDVLSFSWFLLGRFGLIFAFIRRENVLNGFFLLFVFLTPCQIFTLTEDIRKLKKKDLKTMQKGTRCNDRFFYEK